METLQKNLQALGYVAHIFKTKDEAACYLDGQIDGKTVGMGGSVTLEELHLFERLNTHNVVFWHMPLRDPMLMKETRKDASRSEIYLTSVNGVSRQGELVNIDNTGNRVASASFGCDKVYFVIGKKFAF